MFRFGFGVVVCFFNEEKQKVERFREPRTINKVKKKKFEIIPAFLSICLFVSLLFMMEIKAEF